MAIANERGDTGPDRGPHLVSGVEARPDVAATLSRFRTARAAPGPFRALTRSERCRRSPRIPYTGGGSSLRLLLGRAPAASRPRRAEEIIGEQAPLHLSPGRWFTPRFHRFSSPRCVNANALPTALGHSSISNARPVRPSDGGDEDEAVGRLLMPTWTVGRHGRGSFSSVEPSPQRGCRRPGNRSSGPPIHREPRVSGRHMAPRPAPLVTAPST